MLSIASVSPPEKQASWYHRWGLFLFQIKWCALLCTVKINNGSLLYIGDWNCAEGQEEMSVLQAPSTAPQRNVTGAEAKAKLEMKHEVPNWELTRAPSTLARTLTGLQDRQNLGSPLTSGFLDEMDARSCMEELHLYPFSDGETEPESHNQCHTSLSAQGGYKLTASRHCK